MTFNGWSMPSLSLLVVLGLPVVAWAGSGGVYVSTESSSSAATRGDDFARPLDYSTAERAGDLVSQDEIQADGSITGFRNGDQFAHLGSVALLATDDGRRLVPGDDYVVFQDEGDTGGNVPGAGLSGRLLNNVGILRVLDAGGLTATARVLKLYGSLTVGDQVRSRAAQRRAYGDLLDAPVQSRKKIHGVVVGLFPPALFAGKGDVVAINFGSRQGARPGLKLRVRSEPDAEAAAFGNDDDSSKMPQGPVGPLTAMGSDSDDPRQAMPSGDIAVLEVINAGRDGCVARVLREISPVSLGDQVVRP